MRILSFGAGAIGTYIGGSLALAGHDVVFLERPEVAGTLRQSGLRLRLLDGEHHIQHVSVAGSLEEAFSGNPFAAALFALKSFDTASALESMAPWAAHLPPVVCLQNGVENETQIAGALGSGRVIAATVTSAIAKLGAGDIALERLRGTGLVEGGGLVIELATAFEAAGLRPKIYPKAADMKWSKLLTNLIGNATSAILDMTPAEVFAHPGLFRLEMEQLRETLQVMAREGAAAVDLPGTPVQLLALGTRLPLWVARPLMRRAVGAGRGSKMPSFHIDLHGGNRRSEVEYLNGAVVRFGAAHSIETPVNRGLNETLQALVRGEIPLTTFARQPEKLLAHLRSKN